MNKNVKVTISLCKETYGTYITGQQLVIACFKNGHNAGLWELLPVGTSVESARKYVKTWAESNNATIFSEKVY